MNNKDREPVSKRGLQNNWNEYQQMVVQLLWWLFGGKLENNSYFFGKDAWPFKFPFYGDYQESLQLGLILPIGKNKISSIWSCSDSPTRYILIRVQLYVSALLEAILTLILSRNNKYIIKMNKETYYYYETYDSWV